MGAIRLILLAVLATVAPAFGQGALQHDPLTGLHSHIRGAEPVLAPPFGLGSAPHAAGERRPGDLLARMRSRFRLNAPDEALVRQELDWFRRHPEYLERVFTRGDRYLHHIVGELTRRNLPVELALLPIVESAFDPFAYSHGRAAGLWQIIPGTGRRFGLRQDWWYDGRRDVIEATRAALDYLELLARHFDDDWLLAIAAYNSGEGNVFKAIRRNRKAGKPIDFWHLSARLPKETRGYVPRFLALVEIVRDPSGYGVALPEIRDEARFASIDIGGQLDLALAAELAGLDIETLYAFNPAYNRWATSPDGPHRLVIPIESADLFAARIAELPPGERMRWQRHKVRPGETLSQIAVRYSTSSASIRTANKLKGNLIRAGQHLLVPASTKPLSAYTHSADERLARTQNRQRRGRKTVHAVTSGESLWTIARRYDVGIRSLAAWNGMAPGDTLAAGREIVVWHNPGDDDAASPRATPALAPSISNERLRRLRYTVRSGDSLSVIAARFRVRVADLVRWNKLNAEAILRPGQRLTMYVDVNRQSS